MKDYINIGPVPCEEDCAQVGQENYREQAIKECERFIELLRKTFGDEPPGARLAIKWFDHDFGSYCEVGLSARRQLKSESSLWTKSCTRSSERRPEPGRGAPSNVARR